MLLRRIEEFDGPEEVAVVGHGHSRHTKPLALLHQRVDLVGPVEKAVLGVEMEMDELVVPVSGHQGPLYLGRQAPLRPIGIVGVVA
jgi:hypothetical protein